MAAPREPHKRDADRAAIAERYLRGEAQYLIAADLAIDPATVSRDIAWLHKVWEREYAGEIAAHKARELAKIDALERTYWAEWEASRKEQKRVTQHAEADAEGKPKPKRASTTTEQRLGNPAYLAGVQWCVERRCAILGLNAPTKIAPTDPTGQAGAALTIRVEYADPNDANPDPAPAPSGATGD